MHDLIQQSVQIGIFLIGAAILYIHDELAAVSAWRASAKGMAVDLGHKSTSLIPHRQIQEQY